MDRADTVGIYLVEGNEASIKACHGHNPDYIKHAGRIPYPKGVTWKTIIDGEPLYVPDVDLDEILGPAGRRMGIKSHLTVPIKVDNKTLGCLGVGCFSKQAFDDDQRLLEIVTSQIVVAMKNAKQAEALGESEERYRTLFRQSPVGVYIFDRELNIVDCNENIARILGSSREKITGLNLLELKDISFSGVHKRGLNGETCHQEGLYEPTSGSVKLWLSVRVSPVRNSEGQVSAAMAVVEDITDRKRLRSCHGLFDSKKSWGIHRG